MPKQDNVYPPSADWVDSAHVSSLEKYKDIYDSSVKDPDEFWAGIAKRITWYKPWEKVRDFNFKEAKIKWFESGRLNVSYNCLDRHVESGNGDRTAIIWEGNNPSEDKRFTYNELLSQVKKFANVLKNLGVVKGDRVCIYMQMVPELAIAMLACARIGAVHSVVFGAFSADSLRDRINDSTCKLLITQDTGVRGQKDNIPMKQNADNALSDTPSIQSVVVVNRTGVDINMVEGRDVWWHEQIEDADSDCDPVQMDATVALDAPVVELHTGAYCDARQVERRQHLDRIITAAAYSAEVGLECHAGHGLTFDTVGPVAALPEVAELNIGHFIIGEAIFSGLEVAIKRMRALMDKARAKAGTAKSA